VLFRLSDKGLGIMKIVASGLFVTMLLSVSAFAAGTDDLAKARTQVSFIYKRLAAVPPSAADLEKFAAKLAAAADKQAVLLEVAEAATQVDSFYSRTVLNFAQIEANEERELNDNAGQLSDLTATVIGFVKDGKDYRQILSGDIMYIPSGTTYSPDNNTAYDTLYTNVKNGTAQLASSLVEAPQTTTNGLNQAAGIFTLRGYGSIYYDMGTNRSAVRFTFMNYICRDMEDLSDVSLPDVYVRRDVDRKPGGDPSKYRTECVGCHNGMDPQANAFAYFDWAPGAANAPGTGRIRIATAPVPKMNQNADVFTGGAAVSDDSWVNLWYQGTNASLGWDPNKKSGKGPKSWGEALASTKMFPECMAKRVYKTVCLKEGRTAADKASIAELSEHFANASFNMKDLFKQTAVECAEKIGM